MQIPINFHPPEKNPAYANETQYLLLVGLDQSDEPYPDEILWGLWNEGEWWIVDESLIIPLPDDGFVQDGQQREVVPFGRLSESTFFTLKGWAPVWGGVDPA